MKIGLLKLYEVDDNLSLAHGDYLSMFDRLLTLGGLTAQWRVYDVREGQLPQSLDECQGYLITGSKCGVYEPLPWVRSLFDFIVRLHHAERVPLAGICFGHQAIAQALGGNVEKSDKGWGVGRQCWKICDDESWIRPSVDNFCLQASHQDQITQLPEGAKLLATSDFCAVAMFSMGRHILAMQGHPEFDNKFSLALINMRQEQLPPKIYQQAKVDIDLPIQRDICARWLVNFLQAA